ncbi:M23 family metallopeptidase [Novosphingobium sp.]|uniref:M23 family metallopeptidase n=1 Tax=Novosphingobium sp. TaxID=1874826 RepID=UPI0022BFFEFE|nr:M23 family metallopeptidase [Novosphingobium sp.]MCZ8018907.1 M23 family metallopeptidase [Novosphingobium sp.]MCZ8034513.1 M23 family metallopeptidase [Novosphingobium sp.]MCZ8052061.1 M23 family metallopeptidase [Novosphingobium sp.]MCZ8059987.1 M23 family metallopeptidase [Novosphingobium sp.]MCZ8230949.1 M23 family metallopeptidase [Novosphingobium sp.]
MDRLRSWFPDREFFMRSQGQVRFIKVSGRIQMIGAGVIAALLLAWLGSMTAMAVSQYLSARDRVALLNREAKVATAESRVAEYRDDLKSVADDLTRRQDALEKMTEALPDDIAGTGTVSDSSGEAAKTIDKVSAALPEAAGLARIEARQLALVERLTRFADHRAATAANRIRALGLDPKAMLARLDDRSAMGGPLIELFGPARRSLDPRFVRLGVSLERMEALERGLAGIPQHSPANLAYISSGFGYRADPFTGGAAFHAGLDFKGPVGAPIYAAAAGTVSFVGSQQGYGNTVEIDHGNGLMTRYAHMSGFRARVGQQVEAGQVIGLIGNTGRSTGPHLHFEVRINDRAVNPRPFLKAASNVLQETGSGGAAPSNRR